MAGAWHPCSQKKQEEEESDGCHEDLAVLFGSRFEGVELSLKGQGQSMKREPRTASDREVPHGRGAGHT